MKSRILWTLVVVNAVLLVTLMLQFLGSTPAMAQQAARRPGEYLLIPGEVSGQPGTVIYVLDTQNGLLSALTLDSKQQLSGIRPIDMGRVFEQAARGGNNNKRKQ